MSAIIDTENADNLKLWVEIMPSDTRIHKSVDVESSQSQEVLLYWIDKVEFLMLKLCLRRIQLQHKSLPAKIPLKLDELLLLIDHLD